MKGQGAPGKGKSVAVQEANPVKSLVVTKNRWKQHSTLFALLLILFHIIWVCLIPVRNIYFSTSPEIPKDTTELLYSSYSSDYNSTSLPASEVVVILQEMAELAFSHEPLRHEFEKAASFHVDDISLFINAEQHAIVQRYYRLLVQSSEFPAGRMISGIEHQLKIYPDDDSEQSSYRAITLQCSAPYQVLSATRCTQNLPVPTGKIYPFLCTPNAAIDLEDLSYNASNVSLVSVTGGFQNVVSTMEMIHYFHAFMHDLFASQNLSSLENDTAFYFSNENLWLQVDEENGVISLDEKSAQSLGLGNDTVGASIVDSCVVSEIVLNYAFVRPFVYQLIRESIIKQVPVKTNTNDSLAMRYGVSHVAPSSTTSASSSLTLRQATMQKVLENQTVAITWAAHAAPFQQLSRDLYGYTMMNRNVSAGQFKGDWHLTGSPTLGSSGRMLILLVDAVLTNSYVYIHQNEKVMVLDYRLFSSAYTGMLGFKDDVNQNAIMALKLREKPKVLEDRPANDQDFEDEQKIAQWYQNMSEHDPNGFHKQVEHLVIESDPERKRLCTDGFAKLIARSLMMLVYYGGATFEGFTFTAYQYCPRASTPSDWYSGLFNNKALITENSFGGTDFTPMVSTWRSANDGSGWPTILFVRTYLNVMKTIYPNDSPARQVRSLTRYMLYNAADMYPLKNGKLELPGAGFCHIGADTTVDDDSYSLFLNQLYPDLRDGVMAWLYSENEAQLAAIQALTSSSFDLDNIEKYVPNDPMTLDSGINLRPPVTEYENRVLALGVQKLLPKETPPPELLEAMRASQTCYDVLSLRDYQVKVKCFTDWQNRQETRREVTYLGLKAILYSQASMSLLLNVLVATLGASFIWRIIRVYRLTHFKDVGASVASAMSIQGAGVLGGRTVAVMAMGALPFLFQQHLPQEDFENVVSSTITSAKSRFWIGELLVLLGLSWFIKLGMMLASAIVRLPDRNWLYLFAVGKARYLLLLIVFLVRLGFDPLKSSLALYFAKTSDNGELTTGYSVAATKLIVSALVSGLLGFFTIVLTQCLGTITVKSKMTEFDRVLSSKRVSRADIGVIGGNGERWSVSGLLLEGWKMAWMENTQVVHRDAIYMKLKEDGNLAMMNTCIEKKPKDRPIEWKRTAKCTEKERIKRYLALVLVVVQTLYAVAIPLKNTVIVKAPKIQPNTVQYHSEPSVLATSELRSFNGTRVVETLENVLTLVMGNDQVFELLVKKQDFAIDDISKTLAPEDHEVVVRYYNFLLQAVDFPALSFVPVEKIKALIEKSDAETNGTEIATSTTPTALELSCPLANATMTAMTCRSEAGTACFRTDVSSNTSTFTTQELQGYGGGLQNSVAMVTLVSYFHNTLRSVFSVQSLEYARQHQLLTYDDSALALRLENETFVMDDATAAILGLQFGDKEPAPQLASCVTTETLLITLPVQSYVLKLIETKLVAYQRFKTRETPGLVPFVMDIMARMLTQQEFHVTWRANFDGIIHETSNLFGHSITSKKVSTLRVKPGRVMSGETHYGDSYTMLLKLIQEQGKSSYLTVHTNSDEPMRVTGLEYSLLATYETFENVFVSDSMESTGKFLKLAEHQKFNQSDVANAHAFDIDAKYGLWFQKFMDTDPRSFYHKIEELQMVRETEPVKKKLCTDGLVKWMTRVVVAATVNYAGNSMYLLQQFQTNVNPVTKVGQLMQQKNFVMENTWASGGGDTLQRASTSRSPHDGSSWVLLPLLRGFTVMTRYGDPPSQPLDANYYDGESVRMWFYNYGYNATTHTDFYFTDDEFQEYMATVGRFKWTPETYLLIAQYVDKYDDMVGPSRPGDFAVELPGAGFCRVGAQVTGDEATWNDVQAKTRAEVQPLLEHMVLTYPEILKDMEQEVGETIKADNVFFNGTELLGYQLPRNFPFNEIVAANVDPLSIGIDKVVPRETPSAEMQQQQREAQVCYDTLELLTMKKGVRCFSEFGNTEETITELECNGLRSFLFGNWSAALYFNFLATFVAVGFVQKLLQIYRFTGFHDVTIEIALAFGVQEAGALKLSESVLMAASTIPFLLDYHLPADPTFILDRGEFLTPWVQELFIVFGMSWFLVLGEKVGMRMITNYDSRNKTLFYVSSRFRYVSLLLLYGVRLKVVETEGGYNFGVWKLALSCLLMFVCGIVAIALTKCTGRQESKRTLDVALTEAHLSRTTYGVTGMNSGEWSVSGMLMEGWEMVEYKDKDALLRDGWLIPFTADGVYGKPVRISEAVETQRNLKTFINNSKVQAWSPGSS